VNNPPTGGTNPTSGTDAANGVDAAAGQLAADGAIAAAVANDRLLASTGASTGLLEVVGLGLVVAGLMLCIGVRRRIG
jgi:hypothetical protein